MVKITQNMGKNIREKTRKTEILIVGREVRFGRVSGDRLNTGERERVGCGKFSSHHDLCSPNCWKRQTKSENNSTRGDKVPWRKKNKKRSQGQWVIKLGVGGRTGSRKAGSSSRWFCTAKVVSKGAEKISD